MMLKLTKNQGFALSLEDTLFEKLKGRSNWPPRAVLGLMEGAFLYLVVCNFLLHCLQLVYQIITAKSEILPLSFNS